CLLLVLELSRVKVVVLLNYLGYLKYGASSSMIGEISQKQAKLSIAFYLLEKIIKLISEVGEDEGIVSGFHLVMGSTCRSSFNLLEECIEILLLVSMSHKDGVAAFLESGGLKVLASRLCSSTEVAKCLLVLDLMAKGVGKWKTCAGSFLSNSFDGLGSPLANNQAKLVWIVGHAMGWKLGTIRKAFFAPILVVHAIDAHCVSYSESDTIVDGGINVVLFFSAYAYTIMLTSSQEADMTKERINKLLKLGANVILTAKGIDDMALK
ncbi:hypothetical protein Dimus_013558, partial [Dionaea muscipula]